MDNKKVAEQLLKLAKELISADKPKTGATPAFNIDNKGGAAFVKMALKNLKLDGKFSKVEQRNKKLENEEFIIRFKTKDGEDGSIHISRNPRGVLVDVLFGGMSEEAKGKHPHQIFDLIEKASRTLSRSI